MNIFDRGITIGSFFICTYPSKDQKILGSSWIGFCNSVDYDVNVLST